MTAAVDTRPPLMTLNMSNTQRPPRRKSARLASEMEDAPPSKRQKMEQNGVAEKSTNGAVNGIGRKRTKQVYEENDGGFQFSRSKSKRTKPTAKSQTQSNPEPEPELVESAPIAKPAQVPARRKTKVFASSPERRAAAKEEGPVRRSKRLSGDGAPHDPSTPLVFKPRRKTQQIDVQPPTRLDRDGSPQVNGQELQVEKRRETKIMLPFADTPVIQRNKEMRAKTKTQSRRSSSGLRGRRASSLIENGTSNGMIAKTYGSKPKTPRNLRVPTFASLLSEDGSTSTTKLQDSLYDIQTKQSSEERLRAQQTQRLSPSNDILNDADENDAIAIPHNDVDTQNFYKHIEQSLLEPQRMKQLLIWCGARAMPEKQPRNGIDPNEDLALDSARQILEELLKDFATKSEMSSWFDREDVAPAVVIKKPNPRNAMNAEKLQQLEKDVERLHLETQTFAALLKQSKTSTRTSQTPASNSPGDSSTIDATALSDPAQLEILTALTSSSSTSSSLASSLPTRIQALSQSLEPAIDSLADGVHRISQFKLAAERVAERILGHGAQELEKRDKEAKAKAGTATVSGMDLLGALGGVIGTVD